MGLKLFLKKQCRFRSFWLLHSLVGMWEMGLECHGRTTVVVSPFRSSHAAGETERLRERREGWKFCFSLSLSLILSLLSFAHGSDLNTSLVWGLTDEEPLATTKEEQLASLSLFLLSEFSILFPSFILLGVGFFFHSSSSSNADKAKESICYSTTLSLLLSVFSLPLLLSVSFSRVNNLPSCRKGPRTLSSRNFGRLI